ncbi:MAG: Rrf2 family transcriptional regulator [Magnetospirillum sp.]|nr:MAG: Rrf2 family transcriptional regulator [Magnetospirillum sp.]
MKITQFTDYSFRLLLFLSRSRDRVATVREVAEYYGISAEHLKKIVRSLSESGHIQTVRGKHGGLRLAREPSEINLGRLIREQENLALLPCHEPCDTCPVQDCKLRGLVDEALGAFLKRFDDKTLADLM